MTTAALPLENFIQAVQSQLDKAQSAMAVKARNLNLPMTFAIKDINLDLRAHVEFQQGEIRIRPAAANEPDASVFHLVFTAITRPMIEENAVAFAENPEDQSIETLEEDLSDEDRRKLEWVGVRTVRQLRELEKEGGSREVGRVTNLPVTRLRRALERASAPMVERVVPVGPAPDDPPDFRRILRVGGRNLVREGAVPRVTIGGRPAPILKSSETELLVAPDMQQWAGELRVETAPEIAAAMSFDLARYAPEPDLQPAAPVPPAAPGGNGVEPPTEGRP